VDEHLCYEGDFRWTRGCKLGCCAPLGVKRPKPTPAEEKVEERLECFGYQCDVVSFGGSAKGAAAWFCQKCGVYKLSTPTKPCSCQWSEEKVKETVETATVDGGPHNYDLILKCPCGWNTEGYDSKPVRCEMCGMTDASFKPEPIAAMREETCREYPPPIVWYDGSEGAVKIRRANGVTEVIPVWRQPEKTEYPTDPWAIAALQMRGRSIMDADGVKGDRDRQRRIQRNGRGILNRDSRIL